MKVSSWYWPILLIISAIAISVIIVKDNSSPIRPYLALWFLFVCPGMAIVRLLKLEDPVLQWTLAVALSLALDALVAISMLYTHRWSPGGGIIVLAGISITGGLIQLGLSLSRLNNGSWRDSLRTWLKTRSVLLGSITAVGVIVIFLLILFRFHI